MKKVLLIDIGTDGHRLPYLNTLNAKLCSIVMLPENSIVNFEYVLIRSGFDKKRSIINYFAFLLEIRKAVRLYDVNIVHFLCGDVLYRFWGIGLKYLGANVIVTFHHMTFGSLKKTSIKRIFKFINRGIVHTNTLKDSLNTINILNVTHIEYSVLSPSTNATVEESRRVLGIETSKVVVGLIGGTQAYKGIDVFLEALPYIEKDFYLYICGVERDFIKSEIDNEIKKYLSDYKIDLRYLDDVEYQHAINAVDIIVFPYRKEFDGASAILADSTHYKKMVIGSNHGSLGAQIEKNHLGLTFPTGNPLALADVITLAINKNFVWDEIADNYRKYLSVDRFIEEYRNVYKLVREE